MRRNKSMPVEFCAVIVLVSVLIGCTSGASGTLNLAQDLSDNDVATIVLESSMTYGCSFYSIGNQDIKSNPSKITITPGRKIVDVDCWSTFSKYSSYSGGSLIFEAEAGHEYKIYPEDRCLKIKEFRTGKILDTYCN